MGCPIPYLFSRSVPDPKSDIIPGNIPDTPVGAHPTWQKVMDAHMLGSLPSTWDPWIEPSHSCCSHLETLGIDINVGVIGSYSLFLLLCNENFKKWWSSLTQKKKNQYDV